MTEILYILFITWVVIFVDTAITRHNYGAVWNGVGAIPDVLAGRAKAPMQYRVLVPWICQFLGQWFPTEGQYKYLKIYVRVKWASILLAVATSFMYFSYVGTNPFMATSLLGFFFCLGSVYDYGETYWDVALIATAFTLLIIYPWWMILALMPITFVAALTKETAAVIPLSALVIGDFGLFLFLAAAFGCGYVIPVAKYGHVKRYCAWLEFKGNWYRITQRRKDKMSFVLDGYVMFAVLFLACSYFSIAHFSTLSAIEVSLLFLFFATIPITIWHEIRMWNPVMLGLIPLILK